MAAGVPVVAWNHAGPTVTVAAGETGHLATPGDVEDYAAGILSYLGDRALNEEAARRAHRRAGLFSWDRHVEKLVAAIEAVSGAVAEPAVAELETAQAG
jgi:glycosyltransferase involved in cell wall biosynthesis